MRFFYGSNPKTNNPIREVERIEQQKRKNKQKALIHNGIRGLKAYKRIKRNTVKHILFNRVSLVRL